MGKSRNGVCQLFHTWMELSRNFWILCIYGEIKYIHMGKVFSCQGKMEVTP